MTQAALPRDELQPRRRDLASRHGPEPGPSLDPESHTRDDPAPVSRHIPARPGHWHQHGITSGHQSGQSHASPAVIEARDLGVTFTADGQRTVALTDVNLTVLGGEFVSLLGPSGCRKTTL